jgi:hypothetical protein
MTSSIMYEQVKELGWTGHVAHKVEMRNVYKGSVGNSEGKTTWKWEDNIKMDFKEVGWEGVDWIDLAQDRDH